MNGILKNTKTVTRDGWSVSFQSGGAFTGSVILHAFKFYGAREHKIRKSEAYGRVFESRAAATAYCVERGYLQPFVTAWCMHCRTIHKLFDRKSGWCAKTSSFTSRAARYNVRTGKADLPLVPNLPR